MQKKTRKQNFYLITVISLTLFGVLIAVLLSAAQFYYDQHKILENFRIYSKSEYQYKRTVLDSFLKHKDNILKALKQGLILNDYLREQNTGTTARLYSTFNAIVYANDAIDQMRLIDVDGYEQVRVERRTVDSQTTEIIRVTGDNLQYKGDRYYFQEGIKADIDQVWHSKLDLNIENGKIEIPYKPTFRMVSPVYLGGELKGALVMNLAMKGMIDMLVRSDNFDVYLVDSDAEIVFSFPGSPCWSKYLECDSDIGSILPEQYNNILSYSSYEDSDFSMYSLIKSFRNNEGIRLLMVPKENFKNYITNSHISAAGITIIFALLITLPLSWLISIVPSRIQSKLFTAYENLKRLNNTLDENVAILETDSNGTIKKASSKFYEMMGYDTDDIINKDISIIYHPNMDSDLNEHILTAVKDGSKWKGSVQNSTKDDKLMWTRQTSAPVYTATNDLLGITSTFQNITEAVLIEQMSVTDSLTGLNNRRKTDQIINDLFSRWTRYGSVFSVVLLDIDHFKKVNDTYGHLIGDEVLKKTALLLKNSTRETDFVGRWGGEEFIIVSVENDLDSTYMLAEKIRKTIEKSDFHPVEKLTISLGVAHIKPDNDITTLFRKADEALYASKSNGRNRTTLAE